MTGLSWALWHLTGCPLQSDEILSAITLWVQFSKQFLMHLTILVHNLVHSPPVYPSEHYGEPYQKHYWNSGKQCHWHSHDSVSSSLNERKKWGWSGRTCWGQMGVDFPISLSCPSDTSKWTPLKSLPVSSLGQRSDWLVWSFLGHVSFLFWITFVFLYSSATFPILQEILKTMKKKLSLNNWQFLSRDCY